MHRIKSAAYNKCPVCIHLTETDWHIAPLLGHYGRNELLHTLGETLAIHDTQLDLALILIQGGIRGGALANPAQFQMNPNNR